MIPPPRPHAVLPGRLLMVGTGCVAAAVLPLIWRHIGAARGQVSLLGPDPAGQALAHRHGIVWHACALRRDNHRSELARHLRAGDVLLNLSLGVGSLDLLAWCQQHGVLYLDSNLEAWADRPHTLAAARAQALARRGRTTAVLSHGANPGLVSQLLKQALENLAPDAATWPDAARRLGLRVLQVAEFDSQTAPAREPAQAAGRDDGRREFANTWSAAGLAGELCAPAELAWGAHEAAPPAASVVLDSARGLAVQLAAAGVATRVASWSPGAGPCAAWLLAHYETMAMADLLSDPHAGIPVRPTVFYALRPCPAAGAAAARLARASCPPDWHYRVMQDELSAGGIDLGVLLLGDRVGHWYGSRLALDAARRCAPDNNATTLQVAAGVLGALVWALEHPQRGVVEAEDMDHRRVLDVAAPYLGELTGIDTAWRPVSSGPLRYEHFVLRDGDGRMPGPGGGAQV